MLSFFFNQRYEILVQKLENYRTYSNPSVYNILGIISGNLSLFPVHIRVHQQIIIIHQINEQTRLTKNQFPGYINQRKK